MKTRPLWGWAVERRGERGDWARCSRGSASWPDGAGRYHCCSPRWQTLLASVESRCAQVAKLSSGLFGINAPPHTREASGGRRTGTPAVACPGHLNCPESWEPRGLH